MGWVCRPAAMRFDSIADLVEGGIFIVTQGRTYDTTNQADLLQNGVEGLMSGQELLELKRRARAGRDAKFARGEWAMGGPRAGRSCRQPLYGASLGA